MYIILSILVLNVCAVKCFVRFKTQVTAEYVAKHELQIYSRIRHYNVKIILFRVVRKV